MAANYWSSSHFREWIFNKEQIADTHKRDKQELKLTDKDIRRIMNYYSSRMFLMIEMSNGEEIQALAKKITVMNDKEQRGLKQRVVATAIVYFRRFYLKYFFLFFSSLK